MESEKQDIEQQIISLQEQVLLSYETIDSLEEESQACLRKELEGLSTFDQRLIKLENDLEEMKSSYQTSTDSRLQMERNSLEDDLSRKMKSRDFVQVSLDNVAKEREELERGIAKRTKNHQKNLDEQLSKDTLLEQEISDLRSRLETKVKEQERVQKEIRVSKSQIDKIRSDFEVEFDVIQKKEERIAAEFEEKNEDISEVHGQLKLVEGQEEELKMVLGDYDVKEKKITDLRAQISDEVTSGQQMSKQREKLIYDLNEAKNTYFQKQEELDRLRSIIDQKEAEISEVESQIVESRSEISSIEQQIPELEKKKKEAAKSRSFLEANELSKQIKTKKQNVEQLKSKLDSLITQIKVTQEEVPEYKAQYEEISSKITDFKFEYDLMMFKKLKGRAKEIKKILRFFKGIEGGASQKMISNLESEVSSHLKISKSGSNRVARLVY